MEVTTERQGASCWIFQIRQGEEPQSIWELTLAWIDYDSWSPTGSHTPSQVALAVMHVFVDTPHKNAQQSAHPMRLDAGMVRRRIVDADRLIVAQLQRTRS